MNILQLIQLAVMVLDKALPLPDLKDVEAVEKWLGGLNGPLATVIALLAAQWERDGIVATSMPLAELEAETRRVCDEQGVEIDPATIIAIITAIVKLIDLWRSRRA